MAQHTKEKMQKYAQEQVKVENRSLHQKTVMHKQIMQLAMYQHTITNVQKNTQEQV